MNITQAQLQQLLPTNKTISVWLPLCAEFLPKYQINTPQRVAAFFAQASHESADFTRLVENLNYSAEGLRKTFPRYFPTDAMAKQYARQPEKIANRVYDDANRTAKLGNTQKGDGWRFRGRGIFQLTGRDNYTAFGRSIGMTAEKAAEYCATERGAMHSACWFWQQRNLNRFADAGDVVGMSKAINGGQNGLADRQARYAKALAIFTAKPEPAKPAPVLSWWQKILKNI